MSQSETPPTILCALEPNDEGAHVYRVATHVAARAKADLRLINVVRPPAQTYADLSFTPLAERTAEWRQIVMEDHERFLEKLAEPAARIDVIEGYPAQEIIREADDIGAQLIVMGVHNRRGFQRLVGSTTHSVLNHTEKDILAVHPESDSTPHQRALIAIDTSDTASTVLARAMAFLPEDAQVQILAVKEPLMNVYASPAGGRSLDLSYESITEDLAREVEAKVTRTVRESGMNADDLHIKSGDPRQVITDTAEAYEADVIVIGSRNNNLINRLALGSTSRGVLNQTPCDVLVCKNLN